MRATIGTDAALLDRDRERAALERLLGNVRPGPMRNDTSHHPRSGPVCPEHGILRWYCPSSADMTSAPDSAFAVLWIHTTSLTSVARRTARCRLSPLLALETDRGSGQAPTLTPTERPAVYETSTVQDTCAGDKTSPVNRPGEHQSLRAHRGDLPLGGIARVCPERSSA